MTKHEPKNPINIVIIIYIAIVIVVAVVVIGVAIFWFDIPQFPSFSINNPFYVVSSDSMIPNLNINDLLVIRDGGSRNDDDKGYSSYSFYNLKIGDIIVFKAPEEEEEDQDDRGITTTIVHRVAEIIQTDDKSNNKSSNRIIRTKGDANPFSIPGIDYPIREQDYVGK